MNLAYPAARRLLFSSLIVAAGCALAADSRAESRVVDKGSFVISVKGRAIGREDFTLTEAGDSLVVTSTSTFTRGGPEGEREIKKVLHMVLGSGDYALRSYTSNEELDGHTRIRVVDINSNSAITLVNEFDGAGVADTHERPPGRFYVVEPQLYSLISTMAYSLRNQSFDRRPVNIVALAQRDTISEAEIVRLPVETIRWSNRPVQADHFQFVQTGVAFDLWMDRLGRVLRIEHVPSGLRIERDGQKIKPRSKPPKNAG